MGKNLRARWRALLVVVAMVGVAIPQAAAANPYHDEGIRQYNWAYMQGGGTYLTWTGVDDIYRREFDADNSLSSMHLTASHDGPSWPCRSYATDPNNFPMPLEDSDMTGTISGTPSVGQAGEFTVKAHTQTYIHSIDIINDERPLTPSRVRTYWFRGEYENVDNGETGSFDIVFVVDMGYGGYYDGCGGILVSAQATLVPYNGSYVPHVSPVWPPPPWPPLPPLPVGDSPDEPCATDATHVETVSGSSAGYSYEVQVHQTPTAVEVCTEMMDAQGNTFVDEDVSVPTDVQSWLPTPPQVDIDENAPAGDASGSPCTVQRHEGGTSSARGYVRTSDSSSSDTVVCVGFRGSGTQRHVRVTVSG